MSNNRTTAQWKQMDASRHLHPFTDFNDYQKNHGRIIERAEHIYIYDTEKKCLMLCLDSGVAALATVNLR